MQQVLAAQGSLYWAYVPDPPLLQPVGWDVSSIPVYVNDTVLLGPPSSVHLRPQQAAISYKGYSDLYPICFAMQRTIPHCLNVSLRASYGDVRIAGLDTTYSTIVTSGIAPRDIPLCATNLSEAKGIGVPWRLCQGQMATKYLLEDGFELWDWGPVIPSGCPECRPKIPPILTPQRGYPIRTEIWKLMAAFGGALRYILQASNTKTLFEYEIFRQAFGYPQACVPHPFMLVVGNLTVNREKATYHFSCYNCTLTNCIRGVPPGNGVLMVKQPPFIMIPVNISKPWYSNPGLELWERVQTALSRPRREIGLLVLGIVSLITLIATAVTASVSLAQAVHTADTVDQLAYNTSMVMGTQEDIDKRIETRLNAVYDTVRFLGEEIQSLKLRTKIRCHSDYHWICVTPKEYNISETSWNRVQRHLEGI
ncbi:endogenous retrovirus group K member 25 Env polyprotein-like [Mustela lutreola]|uniref:endogenous retrovirus group K member 25 Env polyprotein-like n=1 Tax=Mustela lutreola TaxID=9666 RepID=UPI0027975CC8|nr:endogenous retrovirus group K member 25 Env polyprotein-like [Mustela lutreola]